MALNRRDFRNRRVSSLLALHSGAGVALHSTYRNEELRWAKAIAPISAKAESDSPRPLVSPTLPNGLVNEKATRLESSKADTRQDDLQVGPPSGSERRIPWSLLGRAGLEDRGRGASEDRD